MGLLTLFDRLNLNPRERRLAIVMLVIVGAGLFFAVPVATHAWVSSARAENEELHDALDSVQKARSQVREWQGKRDAILRRYAMRAPALAGFLETSASSEKLQISDSVDRPEIPYGKRYVERSTLLHIKKAGLASLARFFERIELSGNSVSLQRLNIRKRSGEPDSYDVEAAFSAYDRNDVKAGDDKDKKSP